MKNKLLYLALSLITAFGFAACSDDDNGGGTGNGTTEEEQAWELKSVTAGVNSLVDETRLGVFSDNPTASGFHARTELGHKMTVTVDGTTAEYKYENSRWYPSGTAIQYAEDAETLDVKIEVGAQSTITQDGTKEQLLNADALVYANPTQTARLHLSETMNHANTLIELQFNLYQPESAVRVNNAATAYMIPTTCEAGPWNYQVIIAPGASSFSYQYHFNDYDFNITATAAELFGTATFEANKFYRISIDLKMGSYEIDMKPVTVSAWTEAATGGTASKTDGPLQFQIEGYENQTITVTYTDNTTATVALDAAGKGYHPIKTVNPRTIRSIRIADESHAELLIGRLEGSVIKLKLNASGAVQARSDGEYDWLIGSVAEFWYVNENNAGRGTYTGGVYTRYNIVQESDLDFMNIAKTVRTSGVFYSNYDGRNYKMKNVNLIGAASVSLFYQVTGGTIQNVHIESGTVTATGWATAGIVGTLNAGSVIQNCSNAASVTGTSQVAGIAANVANATPNPQIINCLNTGEIYGSLNFVGGMAGNATTVVITGCANKGSVTANSNAAGGMIGQAYKSVLTACYNTGTIRANTGSGNTGAGGMIGTYMYNAAAGATTLSACYNTGTVSSAGTYVGTMVGYAGAVPATTNCYYEAGTQPSNGTATDAVAFSATNWPTNNASNNWGVGTAGANGYYWGNLYSWTGSASTQQYPKLYWE